jgi:hypothetical protein
VPRGTLGQRQEGDPLRWLRDYHPLRWVFPDPSTKDRLCNSFACLQLRYRALQPPSGIGLQATKPDRFGLLPFRSPLLREYSLFLGVLRCFSSPGTPSLTASPCGPLARSEPTLLGPGCPIRESADKRLLATTRSLSQLAAPFFGSWRQGIHRAPLEACPTLSQQN